LLTSEVAQAARACAPLVAVLVDWAIRRVQAVPIDAVLQAEAKLAEAVGPFLDALIAAYAEMKATEFPSISRDRLIEELLNARSEERDAVASGTPHERGDRPC
jgi:hypothetical protein